MSNENRGAGGVADGAANPPASDGASRPAEPSSQDASAGVGAKVYSESEFKDVAAKHDAAVAELNQLRTWKAQQEQAARTKEEQEAAERGEFKRLHDAEKLAHEQTRKDSEAKIEAERAEKAKTVERFKSTRIKERLATTYAAARGTSPALFERVVADFIADGTVKADDDGNVSGHVEAVKKIHEAHPQLFENASKEAVDKALASIPGGIAGAAAGFKAKEEQVVAKRAPFSVAEAHAAFVHRPHWRAPK